MSGEAKRPWAETDFRVVIGSTSIDYDPTKEQANVKNHGYSLSLAAKLLQRLVFPIPSPLFMTTDPLEKNGEIRHNHMTLDPEGKVVFFVTTMRPNETVRVISMRSANRAERQLYFAHAAALVHPTPNPALQGTRRKRRAPEL